MFSGTRTSRSSRRTVCWHCTRTGGTSAAGRPCPARRSCATAVQRSRVTRARSPALSVRSAERMTYRRQWRSSCRACTAKPMCPTATPMQRAAQRAARCSTMTAASCIPTTQPTRAAAFWSMHSTSCGYISSAPRTTTHRRAHRSTGCRPSMPCAAWRCLTPRCPANYRRNVWHRCRLILQTLSSLQTASSRRTMTG